MKKRYKVFLPIMAIITCAFSFLNAQNAAATTVTNYQEFVDAMSDSDSSISVQNDITLEGDVDVTKNVFIDAPSTLDMSGYTMNIDDRSYGIISTTDFTITGDGTINASNTAYPIVAVDGNLTIENGTFIGDEDVYYFISTMDEAWNSIAPDGEANANVYIQDGYFYSPYSVINNFGSGEVVINGGVFISEGDSYGDGFALLNSYDGTFTIDGDVYVSSVYEILGDDIIDETEERGTVNCVRAEVYVEETETTTICGWEVTQEEDEEIDDGQTIQLINTTVTIPAGRTLTNNGTIIVEQGSTINICGTYVGGLANIINRGGTVNFNCEEATEEVEPNLVGVSDNPNTLDSIQDTINMFVLGMFTLTTTSISYPLIRRSRQ